MYLFVCLLSVSLIIWRGVRVITHLSRSVLWLSRNALHGHVTILFTIQPLMDIEVVSRLGLLQIRLL